MSQLDEDLATLDLFDTMEDFYGSEHCFDYDPDEGLQMEGSERQLPYATNNGNKTPVHDAGHDMEPYNASRRFDPTFG